MSIPVPIKNLQRIQDPVVREALDEIRRNLEILYGEPTETLPNLRKKALTYGDALELQLLAFEKVGGKYRFLANLGSLADTGLKEQKEFVAKGVPSGTPGGVDTQLQFNDGGAFAGTSGLTWAKASSLLKYNDNVVLALGTGRDLDLYHNGTNNIAKLINGELQIGDGGASNFTAFELTRAGFMRAEGNARAWNDINIGVVSLRPGATAPDIIAISTSGLRCPAFDGNATVEMLDGAFELLHDWDEETEITFHVHWMPTTAAAGNVKWQLEYWLAKDGTVFPGSTTISVTAAAGGTAWKPQTSGFPAIATTGFHIGTQFVCRLFRDPTDGDDTYPDDAAIHGTVGIHYQIDSLGSRQMTSKS